MSKRIHHDEALTAPLIPKPKRSTCDSVGIFPVAPSQPDPPNFPEAGFRPNSPAADN